MSKIVLIIKRDDKIDSLGKIKFLQVASFFKKSLDEDASGAEIEIEGGRDK